MECIWNNAELAMPPLTIVPVGKIKFDLYELKIVLQNAIDFYDCQINLKENSALCSKLIENRKNSFRNFKGFQHVIKANVALQRLAKINLPNVLKNYTGLLPDSIFILQLPPKVNLDYVLLRIIAYCKLLKWVTDCCKYAVAYFVRLLRNNFFMDTLSLFISVLSKIWYDGNNIRKFTARLYCSLRKYVHLMPKNKVKHCFDDFQYPNIIDESVSEVINDEKIMEDLKEHKKGNSTIKKNCTELIKMNRKNPIKSSNDLGEVISRESFLLQSNQTNDQSISNITMEKNCSNPTILPSTLRNSNFKSDIETVKRASLLGSVEADHVKNDLGEVISRVKSNQTNYKSISNNEAVKRASLLGSVEADHPKKIKKIQKFINSENLKSKKFKTKFLKKDISNEKLLKIKKKIILKINHKDNNNAIKLFNKYFYE